MSLHRPKNPHQTRDAEGVLIFLAAHRLAESSSPPAALEKLPGPPSASQLNLSARTNSSRSAWEPQRPTSASTRDGKCLTSKERQRAAGAIDIMRSASSDSALPVIVSPAYRFIPIGREEDSDGDDNSDDDSNDDCICKEDSVSQSATATTITDEKPLTSPTPSRKSFAQKGFKTSKDIDRSEEALRRAKAAKLASNLSKMVWQRSLVAAVPMVLTNLSASGPALVAVRWLLSNRRSASPRHCCGMVCSTASSPLRSWPTPWLPAPEARNSSSSTMSGPSHRIGSIGRIRL